MKPKPTHLSDEELLLFASEELSATLSDPMRRHLEACSACDARMETLLGAMAEFENIHRVTSAELSSSIQPTAMLKARIREKMSAAPAGWLRRTGSTSAYRQVAIFASVVVAILLMVGRRPHSRSVSKLMTSFASHLEEPDLRLTPGATVAVTESQVCGSDASRPVPTVPVSMRRTVFQEYGVTPQPDSYEVDYLITPELGGATDIRNLWPEPYQDTVWNARVKDQLEDRLHRMVCHGEIDLATAQRAISADWIAAYRKYFHSDQPVTDNSSFNLAEPRQLLPTT